MATKFGAANFERRVEWTDPGAAHRRNALADADVACMARECIANRLSTIARLFDLTPAFLVSIHRNAQEDLPMKCIKCNTDNNLKDRTNGAGRCKQCRHEFAFDPKVMTGV